MTLRRSGFGHKDEGDVYAEIPATALARGNRTPRHQSSEPVLLREMLELDQ